MGGDFQFCRGGTPWPPALSVACYRSTGGHGVPPLQWVFYLDGFSRNSNHDVVRFDVTSNHGAGANHRMISNVHACKHRRMVRDADAVSDPRRWREDFVNVVDIVAVRVDVYVV